MGWDEDDFHLHMRDRWGQGREGGDWVPAPTLSIAISRTILGEAGKSISEVRQNKSNIILVDAAYPLQ